ncbi:MAG: class I adenylate-forming enzyme family protein [Paracoccaceae bacterium]
MTANSDQTLSDWLHAQALDNPDAAAIVDGDGTISYGQLSQAVSRLCSGLAGLGIGPGDVVGVQLPNVRSFIIAFLAVTARGGIFQTLHMPYRRAELEGLLEDSSAKAVIVTNTATDSRAQDVLNVRASLPNLAHVIVSGPAIDGCTSLVDLMATSSDPSDQMATTINDTYLLLYTSGTTGKPKGVPHVYRSFLNNALLSSHELQVRAGDRILSLAPMTHLYGLFTLHLALASGATTVLVPAFNPATLFDDLSAAQATHIFAAPAHFAPFVAQDLLHSNHLAATRLLCLSGATVPQSLAKAVDDKMDNGVVIQLWGMSELQAGTFGRPDDPEEKRLTTAGSAVPKTEIRVVADDGRVLDPDQEGALQVRGPSVFGGYLNRRDETERAFAAENWFATGDLAVIDPDGFMSITGRTKEIINRGGVKFNPVEIEEVLSTLPAILQCAIVPIPDPDLGERGCLCVQLAKGAKLTLAEVTEVLNRSGLAKYKWPEHLVIVDDMPVTPTRKIMRGTLVERVLAANS